MRVPKRKSEEFKKTVQTDFYITPDTLQKLEDEYKRLKQFEHPEAAKAMQEAAAMGDFSENAAYQIAKTNLRRINSRMENLSVRIKKAVVIKPNKTGKIEIGSIVTLEKDGVKITYQILGSEESKPAHGKISYHSPLGSALLGHKVGEKVTIKLRDKESIFKIIEIK